MFAVKKNLFEGLPADVQREICGFFKHEHIKKVSPKFYDNVDDVYWKMKSMSVTNKVKPEDMSYRDFYESFIYEKFMKGRYWRDHFHNMINDEIFLLRHVDMKDTEGWTALLWASYNLDEKFVSILLKAGADFNYQDEGGNCPLKLAIIGQNKESILTLLNYEADIHQLDAIDNTILMDAAHYPKLCDIVKILLEKGAAVNAINKYGHTALMRAAQTSCKEVVELLLAAGADTKVVNKFGKTALTMAHSDDIREILEKIS
jgi:ankyrin repeat protein